MSSFPGSPQLRKGALVQGLHSVCFQYNPESLTRSLTANRVGGARTGAALKGPPTETIQLEIHLSAADDLAAGTSAAKTLGLYPVLSTLEMLIYPSSSRVLANQVLMLAGVIEILPAQSPPTVFIWGPARILPVRITSINITEEAFDPALNPIQARVTLDLQVVNYEDAGLASVSGAMFLAHHVSKEVLSFVDTQDRAATLVRGIK